MALYIVKVAVDSSLSGHASHDSRLYRGDLTIVVRAVDAATARERINKAVVVATADDKYRTVLREYNLAETRLTRAHKYTGTGGAPVIIRATLDSYAGMHGSKFLLPGKPIRLI